MKILLIAGHGAGDSGATGNGFKECDKTRELVALLKTKLSSYATVDVYDTNRNAFYDCQKGQFSIGEYDYALEVHFNAFNGAAYGTEIFVTSRETYSTVEKAIISNLGELFTVRGSGVKVTDFLVINTIKNKNISSALVEVCFIDNANDMKIYEANKDKAANAIVNGIVTGFGLGEVNKDTPVVTPTPSTPSTSNNQIIVGSIVRPKTNVSYGGVQLLDYVNKNDYPVTSIGPNSDRIVLGGIVTAFKRDNLTLKSGGGSSTTTTSTQKMTARDFALAVWNEGKYGTGQERANQAAASGVDYNEAQRLINILASGGSI